MKKNRNHSILYSRSAPAQTSELRSLREVVEHHALQFGFDEETSYRISLAVDEACANIIEHAYGGTENHRFTLEISTDDQRFIVTLKDSGIPFTPQALPDLNILNRISNHIRGGLGLHIINRIMDDVQFRRVKEHENCLQLIKYRHHNSR